MKMKNYKNYIFSLILVIINFVAWFIEWGYIIGFSNLRHYSILFLPFGLFCCVSIFQFFNEWIEETKCATTNNTNLDNQDHLKKIINIASSVILAISILVSVHSIFNNNVDNAMRIAFLYSSLVSFLWIFFGVFVTFSSESENQIMSHKTLLKIKSIALIHALGWASVCVTIIMIMLESTPRVV